MHAMKESAVIGYFRGDLSPTLLRENLSDVLGVATLRKDSNLICDLNGAYEIKIPDLIRVCSDFLRDALTSQDIESLAFFLLGADNIEWDSNTIDGAIVAELLDDWASPETAFPINRKNVKIILRGLEEGVYDPKHLGAYQ